MSESSYSLTIKRIVDRQVVLKLVGLWLAMSQENQNQLVTKDTLFKLTKKDDKVNLNKQLEIESFFLIVALNFNAFLYIQEIEQSQKSKITITFDRETIARKLTQIEKHFQGQNDVTEYIQKDLINRLSDRRDNSHIVFIVKIVKLLIDDEDKGKYINISNPHPSMDKLLQYQVQQEGIFEQIEMQIGQDVSLSKIIQTTLDRCRDFLGLDRLLIYQLDAPLKSQHVSETVIRADTITYEAKQENVDSALYFQEEVCWSKFTQCKLKYNQGFSLVINDIEQNHSLNPCLKSLMEKFQVKAKIITPITVGGQLWGLMIGHQCFEPRQWHDGDLKFLSGVAEYLAVAIYHDRSYQRLQQQKILLEQQVQNQAQQIKDALIAAEAASKSKHEFLGSMSHELRTPLTCVIGLSSTLLQWSSSKSSIPLSPEKQQQYLHLIQQSGKHLLALIDNILEFSDVESGKHLLDVKQISLVDIARQSLQMLQKTAKDKKITLSSEIKLKVEQEYFAADEIRLKEILFNLISNGIKFTPEGGQVILRVWKEKRQVIFQVEDTGIGIAPEEIPLLFEKFKQIEHFKRRTHGGTGLGLALTKKLVELHGGIIEVESAIDEGALFTVYLPEKIFTPHVSQKPATSGKFQPNSATIMLVTEDEESATFICQLLNTIDCQVVWLMDSAMAMNQIELVKPRLIIVDRDFDSVGVNDIARAIESKSLEDSTDLVLLCDRYFSATAKNLDRGTLVNFDPLLSSESDTNERAPTEFSNINHRQPRLKPHIMLESKVPLTENTTTSYEFHSPSVKEHYPSNEQDRWFSQYKVDEYLFKTMTPTQMIEKIESLIAKTSHTGQEIREK